MPGHGTEADDCRRFPFYDDRNDEENTRTGCSDCRSSTEPFILHCDACPDGRTNTPPEAWFDLSKHPALVDQGT
jgi:hypothetical protein